MDKQADSMETSLHRKPVADRKLGAVVQDFEWYAFECIGDDAIKFTGAVKVGVVTKGPRKGRPKFSKESRSVVVTRAEEVVEYERFERETGKCGDCMGRGEVFSRWHHIEGVSYRECRKCHRSGEVDTGLSNRAAVDPQVGISNA